ncbi:aminoglycoside N(3)-acetyltransferase [Nonomuraea sp. LPB2021202275-12-8]|uniref:aminoglycoside N(3)-acetyltransferase n=1 Tax=Nonomuraea sp. LPB2021202275-12-8 TaxID=3120159 RepID=UPI00300C3845
MSRLADELRALGVRTGQVLLVHASMRQLALGCAAAAVVAELRELLGPRGTLVVPAGTAGNSDTSPLYHQAIDGMTPAEILGYREQMPAFDPATSPSQGMGCLAETVRTLPEAVRSAHPQTSFAAVGPLAARLMDGHDPQCHLGESSPLAKLYEVNADILLLGVGYDRCTALHLAEYRYCASPPRRRYRCVVDFGHGRQWWEYEDVDLDSGDMVRLGADYEISQNVAIGRVGQARCRMISMRSAVDFATLWYAQWRKV